MTKRIFVKTFGCQMNDYDSDRMQEVLGESHGLQPVDDPQDADVLLMNTCSVREKAQEKLFSELGRWRAIKEARPNVVIGVGGCVASQEGEGIWQRAPYVDLVFGPQTIHRLPNLLGRVVNDGERAIDISFPEIEKFDKLPAPASKGASAHVSIMEGCSKYCSFCVVPYTRGEEFSRDLDSVLVEIAGHAASGVREITLLGQNVNAYRGTSYDGQIVDLASLIRLIDVIDGIDRIRFTTSHPVEFTDALINTYKDVRALVSHVHLPVQSGSDRVLALMKRGHMVLEYKSILRKLREARPGVSISSDFIVGFPGETEEDFMATYRLAEEMVFDQSFSFIYSPRPGTPAAGLEDDVPLETKKERLARLQALLRDNAEKISRAMETTRQQVLVTGNSVKDPQELSGRTENNRVVNFAGPQSLVGNFADVEITAALPNSLRGRLVADYHSSAA
ncbi:MAG: tRNA (N6-isopentenyl adenosine(37)-C2)-methylthiotransferase MiaB [Pseudomonadota bacterium]